MDVVYNAFACRNSVQMTLFACPVQMFLHSQYSIPIEYDL